MASPIGMVEERNCWRSVTLRPLRVPHPASPRREIIPFSVSARGLIPHLSVSVIVCRPTQMPYRFHSVISPFVVASGPAGPGQLLCWLYCQHTVCMTRSLRSRFSPPKWGTCTVTLATAWNQTLSRVVKIGTWRCIQLSTLCFGLL